VEELPGRLDLTANGIEMPGKNVSLWRYMSLSKLLNLLQSQALWFTRVDQLIEADPYEGSLPFIYGAGENPDRVFEQREKKLNLVPGSGKTMHENMVASFKNNRTKTFVSCWHNARTDNDAMWRLYGAEKDGSVCVQTTVARVTSQLPPWVSIGTVTYSSYDEPWNVPLNAYTPFFRKRLCFQHENEVRLLVNSELIDLPFNITAAETGIRVPIDTEKFLLRIYVSPTAPPWFESVVAGVIRDLRLRLPVGPAPMSRRAFL
jgi:hypothetical protein